MAYLGQVCTSLSASVNYCFAKSASRVAVVVAHETGHNLGFLHDNGGGCTGNKCADGGFMMSESGGIGWSSCSRAEYQRALPAAPCLTHDSNAQNPYATCGDGHVDYYRGEECDPGSDVDPGCNAQTCKLLPGKCSSGDLCCTGAGSTVSPAGTVCRAATGDCDLQDVCDGVSSKCPIDKVKYPGTSCSSTQSSKADGLDSEYSYE